MALIRCSFDSPVLGTQTSMTVVVPEGIASPPPVLYLLHGRGDDDTAWLRWSSIERYADERGLAVVMPHAALSYYRDGVHGGRYWTFLSEELPATCARLFRLAGDRRDTFVAGLSMGGYGALQWALRRPGMFAAAASMSGVLDVASAVTRTEDPVWTDAFGAGARLDGTDADLLALLGSGDAHGLPALYVACGTEDALLPHSERFLAAAAARDVAVTADLGPGDHDWAYWDSAVQRVLAWLPIRPSA